MKKNSIILLAVIVLSLSLFGCERTSIKSEDLEKSEADDPTFWESAKNVGNLIASTVNQNKDIMSVSFRLSYEDASEDILENFYTGFLPEADEDSLMAQQIVYDLLVSTPIEKAHQDGKLVEVSGAILSWTGQDDHAIYSAVDLSGDGEWDFVINEPLVYGGHGPFGLQTASGRIITIEELESVRTKLIQKDDDLSVFSLNDLARLAEKA